MDNSPLDDAESREGAIERLAHHLRGMRSGLEQYATGHRSSWPDARARQEVLRGRYDTALVKAASLLDVPVPGHPPAPGGPPNLSDAARTELEAALRSAGLEL